MPPDLKALALAADGAKKSLDAGAYSSSLREDACKKIYDFELAANPQAILGLFARIEELEKALEVFEAASVPYENIDGAFQYTDDMRMADYPRVEVNLTIGDLRHAARAYKGE